MKIILTSVGTRGDIEPFLAIGQLLQSKEHQVICAFPEQFKTTTEEAGLTFASLGEKFIELLDSEAGRAAMGGATGWKKIKGTLQLALNQTDANKELVFRQRTIIDTEDPDIVIYNGKAIYPIIWALLKQKKTIFVSPLPYMHYVDGHTHIAFNSNYGTFLNKLTFSLAYFGMVTTVKMAMKWLKIKEKISRKAIRKVIKYGQAIYTISPSLFPQAKNWPEQIKVLGYHEKEHTSNWQASPQLVEFMNQHEKILLITFGSMVNSAPKEKTGLLLSLLEQYQIPAIINTASGGLVEPGSYNQKLFHFVPSIPYHWILPKVYAIIHHGGSGTTHLATKYGCAQMIIPHIIDQFTWNKLIAAKGLGPKGPSINKMKADTLESLLLNLINNEDYKMQAERVSHQMQKEEFEETLYKTIIH